MCAQAHKVIYLLAKHVADICLQCHVATARQRYTVRKGDTDAASQNQRRNREHTDTRRRHLRAWAQSCTRSVEHLGSSKAFRIA